MPYAPNGSRLSLCPAYSHHSGILLHRSCSLGIRTLVYPNLLVRRRALDHKNTSIRQDGIERAATLLAETRSDRDGLLGEYAAALSAELDPATRLLYSASGEGEAAAEAETRAHYGLQATAAALQSRAKTAGVWLGALRQADRSEEAMGVGRQPPAPTHPEAILHAAATPNPDILDACHLFYQ